jgi:hypothetical protein
MRPRVGEWMGGGSLVQHYCTSSNRSWQQQHLMAISKIDQTQLMVYMLALYLSGSYVQVSWQLST